MSDDDRKEPKNTRAENETDEERKGPETGPIPERPTDKEPHPSKGASDRVGENVQKKPEDQRNTNDPEHR